MKKLLFTLMLVLMAPAHAQNVIDYSELKLHGPVPEATELLDKINSPLFAPRLMGFSWKLTMQELNMNGFDCKQVVGTKRNFCQHQGYALLPDLPHADLQRNLTFWFGDEEGYCKGGLAAITYEEVLVDGALFGKVSRNRYMNIVDMLRDKYSTYIPAEQVFIGIKRGVAKSVFRLGHKIEVSRMERESDYRLVVQYRDQCAVEKYKRISDTLVRVGELQIGNLRENL